MSFIDKTQILIENSKNEFNLFTFDENLIYTNLNLDSGKTKSQTILSGEFSFIDICLDIMHDDTIYGAVNNKMGKLLKVSISDNIVDIKTIFKYDFKNFIIKFVYMKSIGNEEHIVYYSINKKQPYTAYIIHIYNTETFSKKSKVDTINYDIMTNFVILFNNNIPIIFYLKIVNGFEELFVSTFDLKSLRWCKPIQITNSKKTKIYLSALIDDNNICHITFSERTSGKYFCIYLKIQVKFNFFKFLNRKVLSRDSMCLFPSIFKYKSKLCIKWVEYFNLYSATSLDWGNTWSTASLESEISDKQFLRYKYHSNSKHFYGCDVFGEKSNDI